MSEATDIASQVATSCGSASDEVGVPLAEPFMFQRHKEDVCGSVTPNTKVDAAAPMRIAEGVPGSSVVDEDDETSSTAESTTLVRPDHTHPEDIAYSESGSSESCSNIKSVVQQGQSCISFLPYVNSCAQYAQQVASWCVQGESGISKSSNSPASLCDSKREIVLRWLKRPARRQVLATEFQSFSHCEGQNEYNIWYGRHLTDRYNRPTHLDRDAAVYRCNPELDAGYTAADTQPGNSEAYFCAFFAKGCCTKGSECRYKHRIPTLEDECTLDWSRDVFGRERHRDHRDDMGGAGSFNHECKTLFVGGLQVDPMEEDGLQKLEKFLWEAFGVWGDVEAVRVIPKKLIGFVTYAYRVQAEFARVAMADQNFGKYGSLLSVKWAHQDGNAKRKNVNEEQSKKQKVDHVGDIAPQRHPEQREEDVVRHTLESYCSAWQAYWASYLGERHDQDSSFNQQYSTPSQPATGTQHDNVSEGHEINGLSDAVHQWPSEGGTQGEADTQRLQSILNRVDGLSTADFLKAGVMGSSGS